MSETVKIYEEGCEMCVIPNEGPMCPWYGLEPHSHKQETVNKVFVHHGAESLPDGQWPDSYVPNAKEPGMGYYYCDTKGCPNSKELYLKKVDP